MNHVQRIISLAATGIVLIPSCLFALTVTPGRTELALAQGQKIKSVVTVTNDEIQPLQITVSSRDWFVLPENKDIHVSDWLSVKGSKEFILKPKESRKIKLTVKAPPKAQGELVAMVSFRYITENAAAMLTPMVSVSVYNTISGTEKLAGELRQIGIHHWKDQVQMAVVARATGNIHIRPTGSIMLFKSTGEKIADCPIKEGDPSYPGMDRGYFCAPFTLALTPGEYRLSSEMHYRDVVMTKEEPLTVDQKGDFHVANDTSTVKAEAKP